MRRERRQGDDGIVAVEWRRGLQACMEAAEAEMAMALVVVALGVVESATVGGRGGLLKTYLVQVGIPKQLSLLLPKLTQPDQT